MTDKNIVHTDAPIFEYDYIDDGIYVGSNVCCQTHFDERLKKVSVVGDISLEGEKVDNPYGVEFYLWLPTPDHHSPTLEQFTVGVNALESLVSFNKKVYVHCRLGHGRGPTLAVAYFAKTRGLSTEDAFLLVKEKRPIIHLDDVQLEGIKNYLNSLKNK